MTDYVSLIQEAIKTHAATAEASHFEVEVRGIGYADLDHPLGVWIVNGIARRKQGAGASFWRHNLVTRTPTGWHVEEFLDKQTRKEVIAQMKHAGGVEA